MVKAPKKFVVGDRIFAKVRGYPPWPAKIESITDPNTKNSKYHVIFYGTGEIGTCKIEDLSVYVDNKEKFSKSVRRKYFHEGIQELEDDLRQFGNNVNASSEKDVQEPETSEQSKTEEPDAVLEAVAAVHGMDSDAELGSLVIDESEKKKAMKRKPSSIPNMMQDTPEAKKKRGRKSLTADLSLRQEASTDSQDEDASDKKVSRSGRKIKPKRFHDFSEAEISADSSRNDHGGRGRVKSKADENTESLEVPSAGPPKKRTNLESKGGGERTRLNENILASSTGGTDLSDRFLLARTSAGKNVGIRLDVDRPKSFQSESARVQWDWAAARNAMKLKGQLESGDILCDQVKDFLDFNVHVPEDDKKANPKAENVQAKQQKLRSLRIESQLLSSNTQIRSSLGLDQANTVECLQAMDVILNLSINPLMLKKHSHIVETIKRLRRYIGNLSDWKLSEEEVVDFKEKAELIRQKAELIYAKFKTMFTIPDNQTFWQTFSEQVDHFKEVTKDMSEETIFSLVTDPSATDSSSALDSSGEGRSLEDELAAMIDPSPDTVSTKNTALAE